MEYKFYKYDNTNIIRINIPRIYIIYINTSIMAHLIDNDLTQFVAEHQISRVSRDGETVDILSRYGEIITLRLVFMLGQFWNTVCESVCRILKAFGFHLDTRQRNSPR